MGEEQQTERELKGLSVSKGIAHGEAFVLLHRELETPVYEIRDSDKPAEIERFQNAVLKTRADIQQIKAELAESVGEDNFGCHNTDAHLRSSIIGRNVTIVMEDGELDLGEFGRIHFIDWDQTRARKRTVQVMLIGE